MMARSENRIGMKYILITDILCTKKWCLISYLGIAMKKRESKHAPRGSLFYCTANKQYLFELQKHTCRRRQLRRNAVIATADTPKKHAIVLTNFELTII